MQGLAEIEKLPVEVIQEFRKTGKSSGIPEYLQKYILNLNKAIEIFSFEGKISRAAKKLINEFPDDKMCFRTAQNRINDAITYFHLNNTVKIEAWNNFYADKMEDLAKLAIKMNNITEARRCFEKAKAFRTDKDENAIDPDKLKLKDHLINPDIDPERLGLTNVNLKNLWVKAEEFIDKLDLEPQEKERLKIEAAEATNADYEQIKD